MNRNFLKEGALACRVNINTATREELLAVPFIGEKTADKIIEYRETQGAFQAVEELQGINGILGKNFEKFSIYLKVSRWK